MNLTNFAIKNYRFTLVLTLMVAALGISTLLNMPRSEDPSMHAPMFIVTTIYPGMSPGDMEEQVVEPLEENIYSLDNIKEIESTITNGVALVRVEFEYHSDVDNKYQELVAEVNGMRDRLPRDIYSIQVEKIDPTNVNILQMELISEYASKDRLKTWAEDLKEELQRVKALKNVQIHGLPEQIVRVDIDPGTLSRLKIPLDAVAQSLKEELANIPGGSILGGDKTYNLHTGGDLRTIEEIENIIVRGSRERNIRLSDVAAVYYDFAPQNHIVRLNGYRAVSVVAALKEGKNISAAQEEYLSVIRKFDEQLPADIDLVLHFDQAENVNQRLAGLGKDFLIAIGLVLLTLLPLGNRASFVVMLAIPLSLTIGVIALNLLGYSLNQLSIVGFVVALGLLVDDSIVVVENIERWMREGYGRMEAVRRATAQITKAVLGCTATLVIAFLPLLFLPEASGDFIRSLPVAIIATVLGSMIVALTIVPFFSSKILNPHRDERGNIFLQGLQKVIHSAYAPLLDKGLKHPVLTLLIAGIIFTTALMLVPVIGTSLFPASEKPQIMIEVRTPLQSNIYYTDSVMKGIEEELKDMPEVRFFTSNTGKGNPQIYYNVLQRNESSNFGEIFVQLQPDTSPDEKVALITRLRERWISYPGAAIEVKDFQQGTPMTAPVEVKIFGDDLSVLRNLAARTVDTLEATPGTVYINNPVKNLKSDIRLNVDKAKARSLGVSSARIAQTARMAITGITVGTFTQAGTTEGHDVVVSVPGPSHPDLSIFHDLYVHNNRGNAIPVNQIADFELESSSALITRYDKMRYVPISTFVREGYNTDDITRQVISGMDEMEWPAGYHYEMGGVMEGRSDSFGGFGSIILVASFLFISVLILQFGTFKSTFIVLSVIPLGIVGAVLALLITGHTLSFVATIGIIALAGIEVKNTILQVDFTNELRANGMPLIEAIEKAGEARFLPIILTTLTAIGGLLPIAMSSNPLVSPLAIVMIGGLISSTLLARVVTPVVYKLIPPEIVRDDSKEPPVRTE